MRIPKRYGQSKTDNCPFCGKRAITNNSQQVPVCIHHKDYLLSDLKCQCGDWLDVMSGKYGPFFNCLKCGNISFTRGLEINEERIKSSSRPKTEKEDSYDSKEKETEVAKSKSFLESLAMGKSIKASGINSEKSSSSYKPAYNPKKNTKKRYTSKNSNERKETVVTSRDIDVYFS
jgi:hypothetical protein